MAFKSNHLAASRAKGSTTARDSFMMPRPRSPFRALSTLLRTPPSGDCRIGSASDAGSSPQPARTINSHKHNIVEVKKNNQFKKSGQSSSPASGSSSAYLKRKSLHLFFQVIFFAHMHGEKQVAGISQRATRERGKFCLETFATCAPSLRSCRTGKLGGGEPGCVERLGAAIGAHVCSALQPKYVCSNCTKVRTNGLFFSPLRQYLKLEPWPSLWYHTKMYLLPDVW